MPELTASPVFDEVFGAGIQQGLRELGLEAFRSCGGAFLALAREVLAWNDRAGLTRIVDPAGMAIKHFLDSLTVTLSPAWQAHTSVVDVGSGAGFPGLVLAIAHPGLRISLLEANLRRAEFLRHACQVVGVEAGIVRARAEDFGRPGGAGREAFGLALSRAVGPLGVTCEYALPLVSVGGALLAQIGPAQGRRLAALVARPGRRGDIEPVRFPGAVWGWEQLGADLDDLRHCALPCGAGERWLGTFVKSRPTPTRYPRRAGVPARRPLPSPGE